MPVFFFVVCNAPTKRAKSEVVSPFSLRGCHAVKGGGARVLLTVDHKSCVHRSIVIVVLATGRQVGSLSGCGAVHQDGLNFVPTTAIHLQ